MAWEQRGNRTYYYRSRKVGGRVVKEYVGGGLAGTIAARDDDLRRHQRAEARQRVRKEREAVAAAAATHEELSRVADALMVAALHAAGYHRHDRGQWRKRRVTQTSRSESYPASRHVGP